MQAQQIQLVLPNTVKPRQWRCLRSRPSSQADPDYEIVQECMPYLAARLLSSRSVGMKRALRKLLYGNGTALDVERLKDLMASFGRYV